MHQPPDIPVHLTRRPRQGGLVVPWITPWVGGVYLFGTVTDLTRTQCLQGRRCQVCRRPLTGRAVLFARASDLDHRCTVEPGTCPPCATYSARACPMLAGRRHQHRAHEHPALTGLPPASDEHLRRAAPAQQWFAVWVRGYDVLPHPAQPGVLAASWRRIPPLTIRPLPHHTGPTPGS